MARPAPVDDGSPGRLIATMVGIVGILLLGSLAWSAVGALFSAVGEVAHALSSGTPAPKLGLAGPGTPTVLPGPSSTAYRITPGPTPRGLSTAGPAATDLPIATRPTQVDLPTGRGPASTNRPAGREPTPTDLPSADLTPSASPSVVTPTPSAGRSPWVLLPGPAPGARVQAGPQLIEARGRGDSAITSIRLELDGAALSVSLEQRSDSVWRGSSTAQVAPGQHTVRATIVDDQGRTGSFRWTFEASP